MFGAGRLTFQPSVASLRYLRTSSQAKRKLKSGRGGKVKQNPQKSGRRKQTKLELDHVIEQSRDVLNIAKPQSVYYPPSHITPELAEELVLYKDGNNSHVTCTCSRTVGTKSQLSSLNPIATNIPYLISCFPISMFY